MLIPAAVVSTPSLLATILTRTEAYPPVSSRYPSSHGLPAAYTPSIDAPHPASLANDHAAPTVPPQHIHKRHYYLCEGSTLTWQGEWYGAPFYTASAASYDAAAATGPVQPPAEVLGEARGCEVYRSAWDVYTSSLRGEAGGEGQEGSMGSPGQTGSAGDTAMGTRAGGSATVVLTTRSGTPVLTQVQTVVTATTGSGRASSTSGGTTMTATAGPSGGPATSSVTSGIDVSVSTSSSGSPVDATATRYTINSSPSDSTSTDTPDDGQDGNDQSRSQSSESQNTCAGRMDYQAWAAVASAFVAALFGGAIWLIWSMMRGKIPAIFAPAAGASTRQVVQLAVPGQSFRKLTSSPPGRFDLLTFVSPFALRSSGSMMAIPAAALHLGVISAVLSLGAALPLYIANVPCLSGTSPQNAQGGRLGSLTDLSLLRLLNAIDPNPDSSSRGSSLSNLFAQPALLRPRTGDAPIYKRALSDTVAPATSSARVRLIIVLVLVGLLTLIGGLWLVLRVYRRMERHWREAEDEAHGVDMVVLSGDEVPGWSGGEEVLRKRLREAVNAGNGGRAIGESGEKAEVDILGVFAIPDTRHLEELVSARSTLLGELERAEAADLAGQAFHSRLSQSSPAPVAPGPLTSHSNPSLASRASNSLLGRLRRSISPSVRPQRIGAARSASPEKGQSRFHEINRNSLMGTGGRFEIGQRLRIDEEGRYVPVTGNSEDAHVMAEEGETPSDETPSSVSRRGDSDNNVVQGQANGLNAAGSPSQALPLSPISHTHASMRSRPAPSILSSEGPSLRLTPPHLVDLRNRVRMLNDAVVKEQREAFGRVAAGEKVVGWTVVGQGLRHLGKGGWVKARVLADVRWGDVKATSGTRGFVIRVVLLGVAIMILSIPVIGLTLASAPAFAFYLPFLGPVGRSDGLGSGIVQGLVPAIILTVAVVLMVWLVQRLASRVKVVSEVGRDQLAFKATFWLLLSLCIVWALLVSSLEYAVRAFSVGVQQARFVGDGAIFSSWWIFILLVNVCIVVPGLYILQPIRLMRYSRDKKGGATPREIFRARAPLILKPAYLLAPSLIGIFYARSLSLIFPLMSIPIVILLYLSLIAVRYLVTFVSLDHAPARSAHNAELAMWTIRRIGWCLAIQPLLFGLINLSRREWAIGGVALGVAVLAVVLVEVLIGRKERKRSRCALSGPARLALERLERTMAQATTAQRDRTSHSRQPSNSSLLLRISTLLPGYSRLPADCPMPYESARIDDEFRTELAARSIISATAGEAIDDGRAEVPGTFYDATRANRGLVYPREMLVPGVVVWLPRVQGADRRAAELEEGYELPVVLDSEDSQGERTDEREEALRKVSRS